jgi:hypothetical protein
MPKKYNNIIYILSLGIKKTIKAILSSTTKIRLIIYIEDPKEAPGVNHIYIKEDTKVKETTMADIITTTYSVRSDAISIINLDTSQVSI